MEHCVPHYTIVVIQLFFQIIYLDTIQIVDVTLNLASAS
jgi:hypothetical protein